MLKKRNNTTMRFKQYEIEEINDSLPEIEKMFGIDLSDEDLKKVNTFSDLCDLIISKIQLAHIENCTSQQAFYKLRKEISELKLLEINKINPKTKLKLIFPITSRIHDIKKLEKRLGIKLSLLAPPKTISNFLFLSTFLFIIVLFINPKIGMIGLFSSFAFLFLAYKFGLVLQKKTMKELTESMVTQSYVEIRKTEKSVNKKELPKVLLDWFSENTLIEKEKLINGSFV